MPAAAARHPEVGGVNAHESAWEKTRTRRQARGSRRRREEATGVPERGTPGRLETRQRRRGRDGALAVCSVLRSAVLALDTNGWDHEASTAFHHDHLSAGLRPPRANARRRLRRTRQVIASVKRYPRAVLSTPGTSGYRLSYKLVLRAVPAQNLSDGVSFNRGHEVHTRTGYLRTGYLHARVCFPSTGPPGPWEQPPAAGLLSPR